MKTPREILLKRHQAAGPKLDAIRQAVVESELKAGRASSLSLGKDRKAGRMPVLHLIWHELILPSRRIWAGLAATWLLLVAINLSVNGHSSPPMAAAAPTPEMIQAYHQQERLLAELIGPNDLTANVPHRKYLPQPRSERRFEVVAV